MVARRWPNHVIIIEINVQRMSPNELHSISIWGRLLGKFMNSNVNCQFKNA